jgi:hypothetical protein
MVMDEDSCFDNIDVSKGSSTPMDQALTHLHETMVEITVEYTVGANVKLCDHIASLIQGVGSNIHHLHLLQINKSMHLGMLFHSVDDGFKNSINWMKVLITPSIR